MDPWAMVVEEAIGTPYTRDRMAGVGGPGILRLTGPRGQVALKTDVARRELLVYRDAGLDLESHGLRVPRLLAFGTDPDWMLMEWVAYPLPQERWGKTDGIFRYLAQLHRVGSLIFPGMIEPFPYLTFETVWVSVKPVLSHALVHDIQKLLYRSAAAITALETAQTWVHGDPNPTNWLLNHDGDLVLADWSRCGLAHPAVDVAIALPGMPSRDICRTAVERYLGPGAGGEEDLDQWAEWVALAKLWSFLDFLLMGYRNQLTSAGAGGLSLLQAGLGDWMRVAF